MTVTSDNRKVPRLKAHQIARQIEQILVEHAKQCLLPRQRSGSFPLCVWLDSVRWPLNGSRVQALANGAVVDLRKRTMIGVCEELSLRVAKRYQLTFVQQQWLARLMHRQWFGTRSRYERYEVPYGVAGYPIYLDRIVGTRTLFHTADLDSICASAMSAGYDDRLPPVRAILDPRITNLVLLMQLEDFISHTPRSRVRSAGGTHALVNEV